MVRDNFKEEKMKYLNLGCGNHFSTANEWTNIDFVSTGKGVIEHNLLLGIPFDDNSFDLVYHSHVLEHFSKEDGELFIADCFRVLKPGGVLRVVIPDLEIITRKYLLFLEKGLENPNDGVIRANYEWMKIEMYDQTVRNVSGGNMAKYLFQEEIINEDFVFDRIGEEGRAIRNNFINKSPQKPLTQTLIKKKAISLKNRIKSKIKEKLFRMLAINTKHLSIGSFRLGGEIHQWMYDRYSLANLFKANGENNIEVKTAFTSNILKWSVYEIDGKGNVIRKPDSLFMECIKK